MVGGYFFYKLEQARKQKRILNPAVKAEEITITLIEGWDNRDIAEFLQKQNIVPRDVFLQVQKNFPKNKYWFLQTAPSESDLQGFLYPDTYRFYKSISDRSKTSTQEAAQVIVEKLLDNFSKKLPKNAETLTQRQGLTIYQAIVLASIIEKETGRNAITLEQKQNLDEERKIVAGIFYNRLKAGMPLESDATINYITGKNSPSPSAEDLRINSAYNTYLNKGLPPTPITNPSLSSILAVLNPTKTDYFYFLHKQPSGEPVFSKTYQEHVNNKFKYLKPN